MWKGVILGKPRSLRILRYIASTKHISTLKNTIPIKADEQTATVYKGTYRCCGPLSTHLQERIYEQTIICLFPAIVVLTLVCFCLRKGFYFFPGTVTIFIQVSVAYLQDSNPVAAGLGLAFFILLGRWCGRCQGAVQQLMWQNLQSSAIPPLLTEMIKQWMRNMGRRECTRLRRKLMTGDRSTRKFPFLPSFRE